MTTDTTRRIAASALIALGPAAAGAVFFPSRSRLPDPLPVHWNVSGAVDGTAAQTTLGWGVLTVATVLAVAAIIVIYLASPPVAGRFFAAALAFGTWIISGVGVSTVALSIDATAAEEVRLPWWVLIAIVVIPAVLAVATGLILPGKPDAGPGLPLGSDLHFAPGETVVWVDHVTSTWARWAAGAAALVAVAMIFVEPIVALPLGIVAIVGALLSEVTVRIDGAGMHTLWGPMGWPRTVVSLGDIESVRAELIEPVQWGGWGYRVSKRGVAVVIRRGPGMVVSRRRRSDYAVTVPRAEEGARVLAALIARARGAV